MSSLVTRIRIQRILGMARLGDMIDVDTTDLADGRILYYDGAESTYKFRDEVTELASLEDVDLTGLVDNALLMWSVGDGKWIIATAPVPGLHSSTHEDGGADEISVAGLSGLLVDPQTPLSHASTHEDGGADKISVAGLSGLLTDPQTPTTHASTHESGGADEISLAGLTLPAHASTHEFGGSDQVLPQDLDTTDDPTFDSLHLNGAAPTIDTDAGKRLTLTGNTGVRIGTTGSPTQNPSPTSEDLLISRRLEVLDITYLKSVNMSGAFFMRDSSGSFFKVLIQTGTVGRPLAFGLYDNSNKTVTFTDVDFVNKNPGLSDLGYGNAAFIGADPDESNNRNVRIGNNGNNAVVITGLLLGAGSDPTEADNGLLLYLRQVLKVAFTGRGAVAYIPDTTQSLIASDEIETTGSLVRVQGSTGPVTMTSTPTIEDGQYDGQVLTIEGADNTNTVTIQDEGTLPGSKCVHVGGASVKLNKYDSIKYEWHATDQKWIERRRTII